MIWRKEARCRSFVSFGKNDPFELEGASVELDIYWLVWERHKPWCFFPLMPRCRAYRRVVGNGAHDYLLFGGRDAKKEGTLFQVLVLVELDVTVVGVAE